MKKHKKQARKGRAKREAMIAPFLFVAFVCWYAICEDGTVCSNDGSAYALTKSIAERGSLSLGEEEEMLHFEEEGIPVRYTDNTPENAERYWMLTEATDVAIRDGRLYTDRSPGTSFLAVPFYYAGAATVRLLPPEKASFFHTTAQVRRRRDEGYWQTLVTMYNLGKSRQEVPLPRERGFGKQAVRFYRMGWNNEPLPPAPTVSPAERTRQYFATLLPGAVTALAVALIFLTCRLMGLSPPAAVGAALAYGLCTVHLRYATTLFTHSVAGFFVVLSLYLTLRIGVAGKRTAANYLVLGLAMGLAFVCEYPNALFCAGFLVYLFIRDLIRRVSLSKSIVLYGLLAAGAIVPLAAFGAYNHCCFGKVFTTSYGYQAGFDFNKDLFEAFSAPLDEGLRLLLFSPDKQGVLVASPLMILAVLGFYHFYRTRRGEAIMVSVLFVLMLLIMSKKTVTTGGATHDPRYIAAGMGLLVLGAGFFLDGTLRARRAELRYLGLAIFAGLFIYSAVKQFSYYLTFMTNMEPAERLASLGLTFPGFSRLILIYPVAALAGFVWYVVPKRMSPSEVGDAPGGAKKSVAKTGRKTSRHRKKRK